MSGSEFGLRQRPSHPPADPDIISRAQAEHKRHPASPTLTYEESLVQVPWQTDNKYIRRGYRKRLQSYGAVGWSLIAYWHNETVNIHSHLIGAMFYLVLIPLHLSAHHAATSNTLAAIPWIQAYFSDLFDRESHTHTLVDSLALSIFLIAAVGCLALSAWFHAVQCTTKDRCERAHRGDYVGIVILIEGSFWPCLYYGFQGQPAYQVFYVLALTSLGALAAYTVLTPGRNTPAQIWHRTLTFIALGLSSVVPVAHIILSKGLQRARDEAAVDWLAGGGACYIFGAVLYATRFPEKMAPGTFDLIGASHQIFHCFVLAGAYLHYKGIRDMAGI